MMYKIVFEYFLNDQDLITGWQTWPEKENEDLIKNQHPLPEMDTTRRDGRGAILSKSGKNFKHEKNGKITVIDHIETEDEIFSKLSIDEKLLIIISGIEDHQNSQFLDLKRKLNALIGNNQN